MKIESLSVEDYLLKIPADRKEIMEQLRVVIKKNLPAGFQEEMNYGMIGYVVPHTIYPKGYHCNPKLPLPFMNIASQQNYIAVYHMGLYADPTLMEWFQKKFAKESKAKLDTGKSCIRFKRVNEIPLDLIGDLASKMTVKKWIALYEKAIHK